ncbi:sensor domain-containing diguanylate cyclase [Sulfuricurvum sp. RIFCSPLOWO2_12_FULL_43_24]|uniref:sensor domain-containing diguanylate cyclase n=1 Tax=Sulfuricurvum sp. RIFCSPLOWO2_12_FULL_43_24 TaxID=1802247 RepID=UPI0008D3F823|nr:sensor domain-containing diguanylate cyclase [Sulfuricurvum sp. RIFCSPLOWO2_12_FULL_43_24]OHD85714.1 MAG: hypothetical protein A3I60_00750 [Sulfuricurvum sp. RIFCSPLOWO2_02_FULL_43_45]OHD89165.1 MAG: hypothetical protein A3G19_02015 [Sulfuricurvum sp. RIFCSPLOWO2_12_FULL_43_24]
MYAKLIKVKLFWTLLVVALIPMALISLYSYYNIKQQIISSQLSHLEAISQLKSLQIEHFYNDITNDLHIIHASPYTKNLILNKSSDLAGAKKLFEQQLSQYMFDDEINKIYIIGLDGNIIASSQKRVSDNDAAYNKIAFEEGKRTMYFSDIYLSDVSLGKDKRYLFNASVPIFDYENKVIGVVVGEFTADAFFNQIQDYSGLGESGETLLGKKSKDKVIFLNPLRHDQNAGMKRSARIDGYIGRPAILGATGHNGNGLSIDYRGVEVLAAWKYVPTTGWGIVAKIDQTEAFKPLEAIRNSIALTALILLILGVSVSLKMSDDIAAPVDNLEEEAYRDALTGLPNRMMLMELLEQVINKAKLKDTIVAVMFLDLDGFKCVNDTYGHEVGDILLKNVALRLTNCIRQSDTVARLGGDEFVILLCGAQDIKNIEKIAANIIQALSKEFSIGGSIARIGVSIGISIFPINTINADEIIKQADKAMYEAKKSGKNNFKFTDEFHSVII